MAETATAPENTITNPTQPEPDKQITEKPAQPDPPSIMSAPPPNPNPSTPPPSSVLAPPPPSIQPSFRPVAPPPSIATPQFTPVPTVNYQTPGVPPPGVSGVTPMVMPPAPSPGSGVPQTPVASMPVMMAPYTVPGQPMRPYAPLPNGYPGIPQSLPQGAMPPPGGLLLIFFPASNSLVLNCSQLLSVCLDFYTASRYHVFQMFMVCYDNLKFHGIKTFSGK